MPLVVVSFALILTACKYGQQIGNQTGDQTSQEDLAQQSNETVVPTEAGVTIAATDMGFEPASATVKSGQTITWVNNSSKTVQVGSANHPTHTLNPEITGDQFVIDLAAGESKTVTVSKVGQWGYHDHLKPSVNGMVAVE